MTSFSRCVLPGSALLPKVPRRTQPQSLKAGESTQLDGIVGLGTQAVHVVFDGLQR